VQRSGLDVEVTVAISGGATVRVCGEVDAYSAPHLRTIVRDASIVAPGTVVLDMSEVTFLDSTGLGTLIAVGRELASQRNRLLVSRPSDRVWQVFEMTGTHRELAVERG